MDYEGVVLDLDGTVYRGSEPIPGAADAVAAVRATGGTVCFCSNNPTRSPEEYVDVLADHGVEAAAGEVVAAGAVTADVLAAEHADESVFLIGSSGLRAQLVAADVVLTDEPAAADVVVASFYRGFDYDSMRAGYEALADGARFLGTDPDVLVPTDEGMVPGSGAIINAVAGVAGREPDRVLGKPSAATADAVRTALGVPGERCLVVGDRPGTDLALGRRLGADTALVLSGVTDEATVDDADVEPDHVLPSVAELDRLL